MIEGMMDKTFLTTEQIASMLQQRKERGSYLRAMLGFVLGRDPTDEEVRQAEQEMREKREEYNAWLAEQPWYVRKNAIGRQTRIKRVLYQRYNVPEWLVGMLEEELSDY